MKKVFAATVLFIGVLMYGGAAKAVVVELRFDDAAGAGGPSNPGSVLGTIANFDGNTDSTGLLFEGLPHAIVGHDSEVQCGVFDAAGSCSVTQNSEGVGVRRSSGDSGQLDNTGRDEFLAFNFNQPLHLLRIDFELVDSNDEAFLALTDNPTDPFQTILGSGNIIGTGACGPGVDDGSGPPSDGLECEVSLGPGGIWVPETHWLIIGTPLGDGGDNMRIESLVVEKVPEPITLLLLGAGLVGMGIFRRRGKQAF